MILDKLANIATYKGVSNNLDLAIDFLLHNNLESLPLGRHAIHGDIVFVTVMTAELGLGATWEKHRKYIDIQIALTQGESIAWAPEDCIHDFAPYDAHRSGIGQGSTRKAVVKVAVQ